MSQWLEALTVEYVNELTPYESARRLFAGSGADAKQIWMNANESPFHRDYEIDTAIFNRYPDCQPDTVIKAYAEYAGLMPEQTLVTRGADEGIELVIRAFCEPGQDSILICPPTYGMYAISAQTFNVGVERAPLLADFSLDLEMVLSHVGKVNVVFICSPNNPTGSSVAQTDIIKVLEAYEDKAIVVVDEAYIEFDIEQTQSQLLAKYPNLVLLRTLSKAFALAGLRCGFTLASAEIIQTLLKVIAPYPIPAPVAQIAKQALETSNLRAVADDVSFLKSELEQMQAALVNIGDIQIVGDIKANFLLFRTAKKNELMKYLVENKVLIRDQSKQVALENCLRIRIGDKAQNQTLLALITAFFANEAK
jgi:histidinol-phosphate aminotransferase